MIVNSKVERVTVAVDVAQIQAISGAELPRASGIAALQHGIERMVLRRQRTKTVGAPPFAVGAFEQITQTVGQFTVHP